MTAPTASIATGASDSDIEYPGRLTVGNPAAVSLMEPPTALSERIPFSDDGEGEVGASDFWRRLSTLELSMTASQGATADLPKAGVPVDSRIDVTDADARALLTSSVQELAPILHAIIASKASRTGLRILETYYDVDRDPEEDSRELVMVVRADANSAQVLAFWASLDYELDRWLAQLSESQRAIILHRLGLRFVWNGNLGS